MAARTIVTTSGLPRFRGTDGTKLVLSGPDLEQVRLHNQFLVSGDNPKFVTGPSNHPDVPVVVDSNDQNDCYVWVETITAPGAFSVLDRDSNVVMPSAAYGRLDWQISPRRFDGGIRVTGSNAVITGFFRPV